MLATPRRYLLEYGETARRVSSKSSGVGTAPKVLDLTHYLAPSFFHSIPFGLPNLQACRGRCYIGNLPRFDNPLWTYTLSNRRLVSFEHFPSVASRRISNIFPHCNNGPRKISLVSELPVDTRTLRRCVHGNCLLLILRLWSLWVRRQDQLWRSVLTVA